MQPEALHLLSMWLKEREIQNQSAHTLSAYARDVKDFLDFCAVKKLPLNSIEASDLREYLALKVEREQLSSSRVNISVLILQMTFSLNGSHGHCPA